MGAFCTEAKPSEYFRALSDISQTQNNCEEEVYIDESDLDKKEPAVGEPSLQSNQVQRLNEIGVWI